MPEIDVIIDRTEALRRVGIGSSGGWRAGIRRRDAPKVYQTNPGPGLGILLGYLLFGPRALRPSAPGSIIIHFFGGIHEIYFPYVLMNPRLILAAIAGGASGVATAVITGAGLVATPSPGSIFAYLAVTPRDGYVGVLLSIAVAAGVSFAVSSALLGFGRTEEPVVDSDTASVPAAGLAPTGV